MKPSTIYLITKKHITRQCRNKSEKASRQNRAMPVSIALPGLNKHDELPGKAVFHSSFLHVINSYFAILDFVVITHFQKLHTRFMILFRTSYLYFVLSETTLQPYNLPSSLIILLSILLYGAQCPCFHCCGSFCLITGDRNLPHIVVAFDCPIMLAL